MSEPGAPSPGGTGTITVSGHGEVLLIPDALRLELAVEAGGVGAADALTSVRTTMAELRRAVTELGVAVADQQTAAFNLWQRYDSGGTPNGYTASESLAVLLRDPDVVDVMLTAAADAAGDRLRVSGLSFTVLDPSAARDDARRLALQEAERVAGVYADAAGRQLGPLVGLAEGGSLGTVRRMAKADAMVAAGGMEPGTQTIGVDVTAEWQLH